MLPNYEFRFEVRVIPGASSPSEAARRSSLSIRFIRRSYETDKFSTEIERLGNYPVASLEELPARIEELVASTLRELDLRKTRADDIAL